MNKRSFENLAKSFESDERAKSQKPDEVIALLGDISGDNIMDIGAGTGYFTFRMAAQGASVIAADVDDRFLDYISDKKDSLGVGGVVIRKVEYDDPLLKKEETNHVIIVNTYHHIEDRSDYFTKVYNGLKPQGSLMVVDFKKDVRSSGPPKRYRVAVDQVIAELKKAGFTSFETNIELLDNQYVIIAHKHRA